MALESQTLSTRALARASLKKLGMEFKHKSTFSDQDREYWGFKDRKDVMYDHSATITKIGREFYVSNFAA